MSALYIEAIPNSDKVIVKGNTFTWRTLLLKEGGEYNKSLTGHVFPDRKSAENAIALAVAIKEKKYGCKADGKANDVATKSSKVKVTVVEELSVGTTVKMEETDGTVRYATFTIDGWKLKPIVDIKDEWATLN